MVVALKPLHDAAGIERVVVSTYQAVSGSGKARRGRAASAQAPAVLGGKPAGADIYPHQIAFNVLPADRRFLRQTATPRKR